jgi:hypothetical protein
LELKGIGGGELTEARINMIASATGKYFEGLKKAGQFGLIAQLQWSIP